MTAGIFALGITPTGKIGWIDGEGKRSGFAIDQVCDMAVAHYGGDKQSWLDRFEVIHIDPPFNPLRVIAAIELLEELGCKTVVADIMSQAWDSEGGYLDLKHDEVYRMAGDDIKQQNKSMKAAAAHIKPWTHGKLNNKVNTTKCNLVLLFQAKQKFNAKENKPDEFISPIQESGLTRVALAVGRVEAKMVGNEPQGGFCTFRGAIEQGTKFTHPKILELLPKNGEQFKFSHAEAIAEWCQSPRDTSKQPLPAQSEGQDDTHQVTPDIKGLKQTLIETTKPFHSGNKEKFLQWLSEKSILQENEKFEKLTASQLTEMIDKAVIAKNEMGGK